MFSRRKPILYVALGWAVLAGLLSVTAAPASAVNAACDGRTPRYSFTNASTQFRKTQLVSSYITGPGTISRSTSKDVSVTATASATVTAEAGVVFAKASTALGVSVGRTWGANKTWSYTLQVGSKVTARVIMLHGMRRFTVTKYILNSSCAKVVKYSSVVIAPRTSNDNYFKLQAPNGKIIFANGTVSPTQPV